jgi:hypothetical protein
MSQSLVKILKVSKGYFSSFARLLFYWKEGAGVGTKQDKNYKSKKEIEYNRAFKKKRIIESLY